MSTFCHSIDQQLNITNLLSFHLNYTNQIQLNSSFTLNLCLSQLSPSLSQLSNTRLISIKSQPKKVVVVVVVVVVVFVIKLVAKT